MDLLDLKAYCASVNTLTIKQAGGTIVPAHFHLTELGEISKRFIDCGGTVRYERTASLQLWVADDVDHRLSPAGLNKIIAMAEEQLGLANLPIEVEYQGADTIQKFGLEVIDGELTLTTKTTNCLALDACGIEPPKAERKMVSLTDRIAGAGACTPSGGCC